MWSRRGFLKSAGAAYLSGLAPNALALSTTSKQIFAACCKFKNGAFGFVIVTEAGEVVSRHELPARGHDLVQCGTTGRFCVFARRPGTFAALFDVNGKAIANIRSAEGRHFYGHGVFHPNGKLFYATENDYENARGVIGIYAVGTAVHKIGEFSANGVGPHDLQLSGDGQYLIIANGGIETHPDYARTKLNLSTMRANISWIDLANGTVVASHDTPPEWHKLSLRHLTRASNNSVFVGGQLQGELDMDVPLIAKASPGAGIEYLHLSPEHNAALRGYVGSIELSENGERIAVSSPQGNRLVITDLAGNIVQQAEMKNVCGIAPVSHNKFQFSTGTGVFGDGTRAVLKIDDVLFDNHMIPFRSDFA